MNLHARIVLMVLVIGALAIGAARFLAPMLTDSQQRETSDARGTKGTSRFAPMKCVSGCAGPVMC